MTEEVRKVISFLGFCIGELGDFLFKSSGEVTKAIKSQDLVTRYRQHTKKPAQFNSKTIGREVFNSLPAENKKQKN